MHFILACLVDNYRNLYKSREKNSPIVINVPESQELGAKKKDEIKK